MKNLFCNKCHLTYQIPELIAEEILGRENLSLLNARYEQMQKCYDYSYKQWQDEFTDELKPFDGYDDTTAITMPIKHQMFKADFEKLNKGSIGLDLPTWFNIQSIQARIMLIAQDPLRGECYQDCKDAVLSSPFGLHDSEHRQKKTGGYMVHTLVSRLVEAGYGVYLTDARKYFVYDKKTSDKHANKRKNEYVEILKKEIEIVKPRLCVCLGNRAGSMMYDVTTENPELLITSITLPHLSGTARRSIIRRFEIFQKMRATNENIAEQYAKHILSNMEYLK